MVTIPRCMDCGANAFRKTHGWLCGRHYGQQQNEIPLPPRKSSVRYAGFVIPTDNELVSHIVSSEADLIAGLRKAGKTLRVRFGRYEPMFLERVV